MNVMQLVSDLEIGGAQEVVHALGANLQDLGCRPLVCTFRDGPLRRRIEAEGVPVTILPGRRHSIVAFPLFLVDMLRIGLDLARLVREHQVDVVQTHLLRSLDFLVLLLRWLTPLRAVFWTFHSVQFELSTAGLEGRQWLLLVKRQSHRLFYRAGARWVDGMIAVSEEVKRSMEEVLGPLGGKVTVIDNGVDINKYRLGQKPDSIRSELRLDPSAQLVVTIGRLVPQKGHTHLIEAWGFASHLLPDLHLLIVGDGELKEVLQQQSERLGLKATCHFLGVREDVPDLLAASELFVLPSLWEGFSMALLEAMAAGRPVVATAVSGTVQAMVPGETGLVVPPEDSQALADAIIELLSDPALARAMGQAARRRVEREFSATSQAAKHMALYRNAMKDGG